MEVSSMWPRIPSGDFKELWKLRVDGKRNRGLSFPSTLFWPLINHRKNRSPNGSSTSRPPSKRRKFPPDDEEDSDVEAESPSYTDAKNAKYQKRSIMNFERRPKKERVDDGKTLFLDVIGQFVWIVVYGPHEGESVQIRELSIYGYSNLHPSDEELARRKKEQKEVEKEEEKLKALETPTDKDSDSIAKLSAMLSEGDIGDYKSQNMPYSSDGDGLKQGEDNLGSEPLTSVRAIKNVLKEKMEKAKANDRIVEATTCKRGIERLDEYDERIVELKRR